MAFMVCLLFYNGKFLSSKAVRTPQEFVFLWEKKIWLWKFSFSFCSTLLFSFKNNNPHGPILVLKYWISFKLFLNDCISLTMVLKLFRSIRSSSAQITIKSHNTNGNNKSIFATTLKTKLLQYIREIVKLVNVLRS